MKKRMLCILIALAMVLTMMPAMAFADGKHTHGMGADAITFSTEWSGGDAHNSMPDSAGDYVLTSDITLSSTWSVPNGITNLCLNGHVIIGNGSDPIFNVVSSSEKGDIFR